MWERGDAYDRYMGRWSRVVAARFLERLPGDAGAAWLDVGCGAGALLGAIAETRDPGSLHGVDPSEAFLAQAKARWGSVASFQQASAEDLPYDDGTFDRVVSGLALNFVPDLAVGLAEVRRVCRDDGLVAGYVWEYDHEDFFLHRLFVAYAEVHGERAPHDERGAWPFCTGPGMAAALDAAGIEADVEPIDIGTVFEHADELWDGFLLGVGPSGALVTSLDDDAREEVRRAFVRALPAPPEAPQALTARAWSFVSRPAR